MTLLAYEQGGIRCAQNQQDGMQVGNHPPAESLRNLFRCSPSHFWTAMGAAVKISLSNSA